MLPYVTVNLDSLEIVDRFNAESERDLEERKADNLTFIQVKEPLTINTVRAQKYENGEITLVEDEELTKIMNDQPRLIMERKIRLFKNQRNNLLLKSDWTQLPNAPISDEKKAEWVTYRQALRDLPSVTEDPENPDWPTPPS